MLRFSLHTKVTISTLLLLWFFTSMKNCYPQTVNPALTPGHPDQWKEESPAERIPQPPSTAAAATCPRGQGWVGRLSELPIARTSRRNSAEAPEDDSIAAFAPHDPHQPQHFFPSPSVNPAERPGWHHQFSIPAWLSTLEACVWRWTCLVPWISTNKSRNVLPDVLERGKRTSAPSRPGGLLGTTAKVFICTICFLTKHEKDFTFWECHWENWTIAAPNNSGQTE